MDVRWRVARAVVLRAARSVVGKRIDLAEFDALVAPLLGLTVSRPWRGHGSALFLELGRLHKVRRVPTPRHPKGRVSLKGQATIMIQWSWRVARRRSIAFGSWSADRRLDLGISRLVDHRVESISVTGRLPELVVALSGGFWVEAFSTVEGQPEWTTFLPDGSWISTERGVLVRTQPERRRAQRGRGA